MSVWKRISEALAALARGEGLTAVFDRLRTPPERSVAFTIAIIALGAVIRGDTPHFDFVAAEASRGLSDVAMNHDIPVANGVLTCDTVEQALIRAGEEPAEETEVDQKKKPGNKGREAALAAIEMVNLLKAIGEG